MIVDWGQFYTYDDMNRLATADRGDLNVGKDAITGTAGWEEWALTLDAPSRVCQESRVDPESSWRLTKVYWATRHDTDGWAFHSRTAWR